MATSKAKENTEANESSSKAALQRQIEETRESITHTVEEIKDTVADQYESVKETVTEVLDWREQFRDNPLVWGLGAVAAGFVMGYSIAIMRHDSHTTSRKRKTNAAFPETLFHEISRIGENVLLPTVVSKVKELFGIDLSDELLAHKETAKPRPGKRAAKKAAKRRPARKATKD